MKDEFTEWKYMGNIKNTNDKVPNDSGVYILHTIRKYLTLTFSMYTLLALPRMQSHKLCYQCFGYNI